MEYKVIRSKRKTISLSVGDDLIPVVRAPYSVSNEQIEDFVAANSKWLKKATQRKKKQLESYALTDDEIAELKKKAMAVIPEKVKNFSALMGLTPTGVKITSARKRFGSCNGRNSLCFSCFLMLYPDEAVDYVVAHELAHIKYHNHGSEFYNMIKQYMPDYKEREKVLK